MKSYSRCWAALAALSVLPFAVPAANQKKGTSEMTFGAVVEAHFADWDRDRDGHLSQREIDSLIVNPKVEGPEAAAVAAIHAYMRDHKNAPAMTKAVLLQQADAKETAERRDLAQKKPHFTANYQSFLRHIHKAPRDVFATMEAPSLTGFSQGSLGDCYFCASVASAINTDQAAFRKIFHPRPDGSCDVHFYSGHSLHLPKLTDAEIALTSSAGDGGVWLNIAEKAFGDVKLTIRKSKKPPKEQMDLDIIAHGGFPSEAIEVLSGHQAKIFDIRKKESAPPLPRDIPRITAEIHGALSAGMPRKYLFCCSVGSGKYPPGIVTDHAYAILGYNPSMQVVTVMNPWGNHFEPKGTPGMANGYSTKGGKFDVPLHDFVMIFDCVYYQTPLPSRK